MLANPGIDYQVHNTLFLVAHFHNVLIPGLLFGMLAGYHYWFPKAFGFRLDERWGMIAAVCWIVGFMLAFFPLYALGLLGCPRRRVAYSTRLTCPDMIVALLGAFVLLAGARQSGRSALGIGSGSARRTVSSRAIPGMAGASNGRSRRRRRNTISRSCHGDRPRCIHCAQRKVDTPIDAPETYRDIEMPKNSAMGGDLWDHRRSPAPSALVWHIWWMVILGLIAVCGDHLAGLRA